MANIVKLNLNWKNNQSPALNQTNLNSMTTKINEIIDRENDNQSYINTIPRRTNELTNDAGFLTQYELGRTNTNSYAGSSSAISKDINVGFYPSYAQIIEKSPTNSITGTYLFTHNTSATGDYAIVFTNNGITIDCISGGTLNKVGYTYIVQSRFEWDFHASAKPVVVQLTKGPEDIIGTIEVELKDNYIYYIDGYKALQFNPPANVPTYNCYVYITLSSDTDYTPSVIIPTYSYGDDIRTIYPGNRLELSIDGLGGTLVLNKGAV